MGAASSCTSVLDVANDAEVKACVKSILEWEEAQRAGQRATQALRTVRKDSFKKAANDLGKAGSIVERIGGADMVHDVIQAFYRKLFAHAEVRHFFENLSAERMRSKQMKFMRYIIGGPGTYTGNLRCVHASLVKESGLDLPKFQLVQELLGQTMAELRVPQDVIDDIIANTELAKEAIFTPNADELVSSEEMQQAANDLKHPFIARMGGPEVVQRVVQLFYKKLFASEELKYFFINMSTERLRNMQFKFMRYLFCGAASYAQTGGNMRCVHARLVKEDGLDLEKFNSVVAMLQEALVQEQVSKAFVKEVMKNVDDARKAIFTPGPEELVTKEEMMEEAAKMDAPLVERAGGPEAVYELIRVFYSKLFNDEELKYFFMLSTDRLRNKQFRFMRYLLAGPEAYAAMGGNLRCKHAALVRDKGLTAELFDRVAGMLTKTARELLMGEDVVSDLLKNVEAAKHAIFTPGPDELVTKEEMMVEAAKLESDLVTRMGGPAIVFNVVSSLYAKLFNDEELKLFFANLTDSKLRTKQIRLMSYLFGGPPAYAAASGNGSLRCVHARLVREGGLDAAKFEKMLGMLVETLKDEGTAEDVIGDILKNAAFAKQAIFTPGPDELISKEEMVAEAASLDSEAVARLGGPEAVYELSRLFYGRLFHDDALRYFFTLSADRLRTKQFRFMRYLVGGAAAYRGDLRCVHAPMVAGEGGLVLDATLFDRAVAHLAAAAAEMVPPLAPEALAALMANVQAARVAILGAAAAAAAPAVSTAAAAAAAGAAGAAGPGGSRAPSAALASSRSLSGASAARSLHERLGGDAMVGALVDLLQARMQADPQLGRVFAGVDMLAQRRRQLAFMRAALGGGGGGSRPSSAASAEAAAAGMSMGMACAHLARAKGLTAAHFEAIAAHLSSCLTLLNVAPAAAAELLGMLGPGKSIIFPPGAASGCPFAASMFGDEEEAELDAIISSAAASATGAAAAAPPQGQRQELSRRSNAASVPAEDAGVVALSGQATPQLGVPAGGGVAGQLSRQGSMTAGALKTVDVPASPPLLSRQPSSTRPLPLSRQASVRAGAAADATAAAAAAVGAPAALGSPLSRAGSVLLGTATPQTVAAAAAASPRAESPASRQGSMSLGVGSAAAQLAATPVPPIAPPSRPGTGSLAASSPRQGAGPLDGSLRRRASGARSSLDSASGQREAPATATASGTRLSLDSSSGQRGVAGAADATATAAAAGGGGGGSHASSLSGAAAPLAMPCLSILAEDDEKLLDAISPRTTVVQA